MRCDRDCQSADTRSVDGQALLILFGGLMVGVGLTMLPGVAISRVLAPHKREMGIAFATLVVAVGLYVIARGIRALS